MVRRALILVAVAVAAAGCGSGSGATSAPAGAVVNGGVLHAGIPDDPDHSTPASPSRSRDGS